MRGGSASTLAGAIRQLVQAEVAAAVAEWPARDELLSTAEAAQYAKITPRSIRRWLDEGKLRVLHAGRELRIRRVDLDELTRSGSRRKAAELSARGVERGVETLPSPGLAIALELANLS